VELKDPLVLYHQEHMRSRSSQDCEQSPSNIAPHPSYPLSLDPLFSPSRPPSLLHVPLTYSLLPRSPPNVTSTYVITSHVSTLSDLRPLRQLGDIRPCCCFIPARTHASRLQSSTMARAARQVPQESPWAITPINPSLTHTRLACLHATCCACLSCSRAWQFPRSKPYNPVPLRAGPDMLCPLVPAPSRPSLPLLVPLHSLSRPLPLHPPSPKISHARTVAQRPVEYVTEGCTHAQLLRDPMVSAAGLFARGHRSPLVGGGTHRERRRGCREGGSRRLCL
jgi:hypothetical protein